jgi:hypothetical protein
MKRLILLYVSFLCIQVSYAQKQRWILNDENGITWNVKKGETHSDHIEMSGKQVSVFMRYSVNEKGGFELNKGMVWPMLRTIPNNTHASLMRRILWNPAIDVKIDGFPYTEQVKSITLNGTLEVISDIVGGKKEDLPLTLKRTYFPAPNLPTLVEIYQITNVGKKKVSIEIPFINTLLSTDSQKGVGGSYNIYLKTHNAGFFTLDPGKSCTFSASISGYKQNVKEDVIESDKELAERRMLVVEWMENLVLETPDPVLNRMFAFSKIRTCESIFETKGGPMHAPGGESFYAAVWANDQAEYVNPYFPYIGYKYGNASALNSFKHFARYMNDEWKPIPSSIIAEGDSYWHGAGDRGDGAMLAYGASRFALAAGDKEMAKQLWPLIEWCLEYCHRKINEEGVVASNSDELEGRFPAGKANLCTSSLYYDALLSAAYLAEDLGKERTVVKKYREEARRLEKSIDSYFSSTVEGFDTYAYYKGNDVLRSWICIPLTVGINKRAKGTLEALFSPRLWTENGLLTQAGSRTYWDRSTLYALRGVFMAGEVEKAMEYLKRYSYTRFLGDHVPYAIEAWPEGGRRHLAAESGLYGRIYTEGLFGIRPTGLHSFTLTPRLPKDWEYMAFRRIRAFGSILDITVTRELAGTLRVIVKNAGKVVLDKKAKEGTTFNIKSI